MLSLEAVSRGLVSRLRAAQAVSSSANGAACIRWRRSASSSATQREVILTFSGKVHTSTSSKIWTNAANVMKTAGANIQAAGGTFVRMPHSNEGKPLRTTFSVSAFGAHISPKPLAVDSQVDDSEDLLGCTLYLKAVLPEDGVEKMMALLQTESPLQVYTIFLGGKSHGQNKQPSAEQGSLASRALAAKSVIDTAAMARRKTGILYLFGIDRPGQLSHITETLCQFGVTILHLRVQSGYADVSECDFVPAPGGALAENRIEIMFNESMAENSSLEDKLTAEIERRGKQVGYAVTSLMTDGSVSIDRTLMRSYQLKRQAFAMTYLDALRDPGRLPGARIACARLMVAAVAAGDTHALSKWRRIAVADKNAAGCHPFGGIGKFRRRPVPRRSEAARAPSVRLRPVKAHSEPLERWEI